MFIYPVTMISILIQSNISCFQLLVCQSGSVVLPAGREAEKGKGCRFDFLEACHQLLKPDQFENSRKFYIFFAFSCRLDLNFIVFLILFLALAIWCLAGLASLLPLLFWLFVSVYLLRTGLLILSSAHGEIPVELAQDSSLLHSWMCFQDSPV